jgi:hypothetical protein
VVGQFHLCEIGMLGIAPRNQKTNHFKGVPLLLSQW